MFGYIYPRVLNRIKLKKKTQILKEETVSRMSIKVKQPTNVLC